ncbi:CheA signal transduction histidine kinase [Desulfocurvibacter africanus PCS]|uniref:Chemotaxis protein CheA n=1 Tax=Desulfocurvibacter africanus PCS TaxID=1262666 RepID=M5PXP8_DESAF|nr:chemotaxis protein CheA [Desulfocurvibacter africanus]EMG38824.1 CheA signal transduction histidine kinase [Desulfocurvibacter africanus PCS]
MSRDDLNRLAFKEEAHDLLSELESALLELEATPDDRETIDRVFRAMHTIKGSGAMFGFDDIARFTHEVETVFDLVRNGQLAVSKELLDLTLVARDRIMAMLSGSESGIDQDPAASQRIVKSLKSLLGQAGVVASLPEPKPESSIMPSAAMNEDAEIFRIHFKPPRNVFLSGTDPLALLEELAALGTCKVTAHLDDVPVLSVYEPDACYAWWNVIIVTKAGRQALQDVFIFVEDDSEISIDKVEPGLNVEVNGEHKKLGEILVDRGDITEEDLLKALGSQKRIGAILTESGVVSPAQVASALAEQAALKDGRVARKPQESVSSIRVAAEKLDKLVDLVGELVIVQAQVNQYVVQRKDPYLAALSEQLGRLSDELRDSTLGIRMLPIGTTFSKFKRLVRDLSDALGKEIELETEGAETELDKTVIERFGDPLVHLLRNSIDHGIELPAERLAQGKPRHGTIKLTAEHSGGDVLIRIFDDGKGLDAKTIFTKAVEKGLVSPDAELSEKEIFNFIFAPGFSTAKAVTSVSGRGVGMDVVKQAIDSLRGSIDIASNKGLGTTITIKLPLTLAIIDGLQVQVENEFYVIPLSLVEECVELIGSKGNGRREQRIIHLRGEVVPYIRMREWFDISGTAPEIEQVVITSQGDNRVGIVVDHVIGEHQTVIKSLGRVYREVEGISGATIKGDGSMALILDIPRLVRSVLESCT